MCRLRPQWDEIAIRLHLRVGSRDRGTRNADDSGAYLAAPVRQSRTRGPEGPRARQALVRLVDEGDAATRVPELRKPSVHDREPESPHRDLRSLQWFSSLVPVVHALSCRGDPSTLEAEETEQDRCGPKQACSDKTNLQTSYSPTHRRRGDSRGPVFVPADGDRPTSRARSTVQGTRGHQRRRGTPSPSR